MDESVMNKEISLLVGTYTKETHSDGIYRVAGSSEPELVARCDNPSYLVAHPRGDVIYAVSEVDNYKATNTGVVSALFIQANGQLTEMNRQPSMGADPCHITVADDASFLVVSNYSGGTFTTFPLDEDGHLENFVSMTQHTGSGVFPDRQRSAHIHSSHLIAHEQALLVADLGSDQLVKYQISPQGQISSDERQTLATTPGAGPRLMTLCGDYIYLLNELNNSVTKHRSSDLIVEQSCSTLPPGCVTDSIAAHIEISPDGKFLYASNRGHDSISVFSLKNGIKQEQNISSGGAHPRHFALSPNGEELYVANMLSNQISSFSRDKYTGLLNDSGKRIAIPSPTCVLFL
ncbi:MAG: 6-phosphogluconolactonase [Sulfitobacter sp.]|jgi:6-phosphogluconolactonase